MSALVALALVAAACGSDDSGTSAESSPDTTATSENEDSAPAETSGEQSDEPVEVVIIPHFRSPFTQLFVDGAEEATAEFANAELVVAGPAGFDAPAATAALTDAIAAGADGAAVVPFPAEVWARSLADAGVPLATLNVPPEGSDVPLYVGVNEFDVGAAIADVVIEQIGADAEGSVVLGNCFPGLGVLENRVDGFKEQISQGSSTLTVEGAFDTLASPTDNLGAWESLVIANPDALAFAGVCAFDLPNLITVKDRRGADFAVGGNDFDPEVIRGLQEGLAAASIGQSPFMQGYVATRALLENLVNGTPMPVGWIDSGIERADASNIDEIAERETDPALMKAWYQDQIDKIFADSSAAARPLADLDSRTD